MLANTRIETRPKMPRANATERPATGAALHSAPLPAPPASAAAEDARGEPASRHLNYVAGHGLIGEHLCVAPGAGSRSVAGRDGRGRHPRVTRHLPFGAG